MIKAVLGSICLVICFSGLKAQGKINVRITNLENNKGVCRLCLFNNEAAFSNGKAPYKCSEVAISNKVAIAAFESVPAGNYAIAVFHDINNNGKMDKNFLGIPKEGYGASRNKLPFASAPGYKDNVFAVSNNAITTLNIRLRNL